MAGGMAVVGSVDGNRLLGAFFSSKLVSTQRQDAVPITLCHIGGHELGAILRRLMHTSVALSVGLLSLSLVVSLSSHASIPSSMDAETVDGDRVETVTIYLPHVVRHPIDPGGSTLIPPYNPEMEQSIADMLNQRRGDNGLSSLSLVSELTQAARRHALDMAENDFTGHTGFDGSNAAERMQDAGYDPLYWGEIIGWGFGGSAESMIDWWMNSPTHRSIILSTRFEDFGVGYVYLAGSDWGHYWTVVFGTRGLDRAGLADLSSCISLSRTAYGGSSLMFYGPAPCQ
jgi:uncharacterized protein YkwD